MNIEIQPLSRANRPDRVEPLAGYPPELEWVRVSDLVVEGYQRTTDEKASQKLVRLIAAHWNWDRVGAIIVRPVLVNDATRFALIDGQHRAMAAAARGDIDVLPAAIIATEGAEDAARTFIGLNLNRSNLSAQAVFHAEVAAGNPSAFAINQAARSAGAVILRSAKPPNLCAPGEISAIATLRNIHIAKGRAGLAHALRITVAARLAPIQSIHLEAVFIALFEPGFAGRATDSQISRTLCEDWELIKDAADLAVLETGEPKKRAAAIELVNRAERRA